MSAEDRADKLRRHNLTEGKCRFCGKKTNKKKVKRKNLNIIISNG